MKLIIFDIDGTLCHSKYVDDRCFIRAFEIVLGTKLKNTDWNSYGHATELHITKQILNDLKENSDIGTINKIINAYTDELKTSLEKIENSFIVIPGARELFEYLINHKDYKVGIATAGFLKPAKYKLSALGFNIQDIKIYSSDSINTKYEMISLLIENYKEIFDISHFNKVFYVGDREYDYSTTVELGINFIGIDYENNNKLMELGLEDIINNYDPMEKFLALV